MAVLTSPTLGKLVSNVRNFLGQTNASNSRWSDEELTEYINEGIRMYFGEVVLNAEGQFTTQVDLNLVSGVDTVALPDDFFQVKSLYRKVSTGYIMLNYQNNITTGYYSEGASTDGDSYIPYYFFRNNNVVLRPIPQGSETAGLRLEYIAFPDTLINGGDVMTNSVSPVFKQLIEMYAVYKAKVKDSLVDGVDLTAVVSANLAQIYQQFKAAISSRSKYPQFTVPYSPEDY